MSWAGHWSDEGPLDEWPKVCQLSELWSDDNERDPGQHLVLLRLQGRKITDLQGYQDYFRKQKQQRDSQHRYFHPKKRERCGQGMTDPDAVVDHAVAKATADDLLENLSGREAQAMKLVFGEERTIPQAADVMCMPAKEIRQILASALTKAAKKIAL